MASKFNTTIYSDCQITVKTKNKDNPEAFK